MNVKIREWDAIRLWIGMVSLSLSWVLLLPYYSPSVGIGALILIVGLTLFCASFPCSRGADAPEAKLKQYVLCAIPLALISARVSFPENLGPCLVACGLVLTLSTNRLRKISVGLVVAGIVMSLQALALPFFVAFEARYHHIGFLEPVICRLLRMLSVTAQPCTNGVFIRTPGYEFILATTSEKLNLLLMTLVLVSWITMRVILRKTHKGNLHNIACETGQVFTMLLAFFFARYVFLLLITISYRNYDIFWLPAWVVGSFLPLVLVPAWQGFVHTHDMEDDGAPETIIQYSPKAKKRKGASKTPKHEAGQWAPQALACIIGFLFVFALGFQDPGIKKQGRILIDEKHTIWEKTTRPYDTLWYGEDSGYNYYSLAAYLQDYYDVAKNLDSPISRELLETCDVLILKTPTAAYDKGEIDAIWEFVQKGGGLFLIGDHTNVFGTSTYLNPVAERFGLRFKYDGTYDLKTGGLSIYEDRSVFRHPSVIFLPKFLFATSCSMEVSPSATGVITGYGVKSLYLDYSHENFFATDRPDLDKQYGLLIQAAAVSSGKGRVVAFTDSTVWSNFFMFIPGKWELLIGMISWLNRRAYLTGLPIALLGAAVVLLCRLISLFPGRRRDFVPLAPAMAFATLIGISLAVWSSQSLAAATYRHPPKIRNDTLEVAFEKDHTLMLLPEETIFLDSSKAYHTFYTWVQRVEGRPRVASLRRALECDVVVLMNITKRFSDREYHMMRQYLESGGYLLIMHGNGSSDRLANEFLRNFGLSVKEPKIDSVIGLDGEPIQRQILTYQVAGGKLQVRDTLERTVAAEKEIGEGKVLVFAAAQLFSDELMGTTSTIPDSTIKSIYDLEFWLIEKGKEGKGK
jgi:hypothetical protein